MTSCDTPEEPVATYRAHITGRFVRHKLLSSDLSPIGNCPENDFFPDCHGKFFHILTGKIVTLMTSLEPLCLYTVPDRTLPTIDEDFIRLAAPALDVIHGQMFTPGKDTLAGNATFVERDQPLFELAIIVPARDIDGANPAIETARSDELMVCRQDCLPRKKAKKNLLNVR